MTLQKAIWCLEAYRDCSTKGVRVCDMDCSSCEFGVSDDDLFMACDVAVKVLKVCMDSIETIEGIGNGLYEA